MADVNKAPARTLRIKICGVTEAANALDVAKAGADLIGLNFVPSSKRLIDEDTARRIVSKLPSWVEVVAIVADLGLQQMLSLRQRTGVHSLQLHGLEDPAVMESLQESDYKAVRVAESSDVVQARRYPGPRLLVDAKVSGVLGGSGHTFDWSVLGDLPRQRQLLLAGGLTPANVADAVSMVRPWAVDVASGVETRPGFKDLGLVEQFIAAARSAAGAPR